MVSRRLLVCLWVGALAAQADDLTERLARVGTWDGKTESATLAGPYEDPLQQQVPFGRRSYYLAPWRAYMDTWPTSRYLDCLGVYFATRQPAEAEAAATVLAEAGIRHARVEVGWGSFRYDDPSQLEAGARQRLATALHALRGHGIRPLILLNANSGWPVPTRGFHVKLTAPAAVGARALLLDHTDQVQVGRTGPRGQDYQLAYPLITAVDAATGRCTLSAPLKQALPAGDLELFALRYEPFGGGPTFADGHPTPALAETVAGWRTYVRALLTVVREEVASTDPADAGFDCEVWNELTFGSQFLEDSRYYDPPRQYAAPWTYAAHGLTGKGYENLLRITADDVADPPARLPGVRVIDGFANQRPWESGTAMWPTQTGFSRHYYTDLAASNPTDPKVGTVCAATMSERDQHSGPLNALGLPDGTPDGKDWHTVLPGTFFVPTFRRGHPEYFHYAYQTEFMTRDLQPFPGPWQEHHRYSHPGTGRPAEVWQTEFNAWRQPWVEGLLKQGVDRHDPALRALSHAIGAKNLLRSFVFFSHKGQTAGTPYAIQEDDLGFAILPEAFYAALAAAKGELTPAVRAQIGPQLTVLRHFTEQMRRGQPLAACRPLRVSQVVEHRPRLVFAGDGTPAHPDRYQRDDFAVLPFQLAANRYAIAYYVVTRDLVHVWDPTKGLLDPARYTLPDQSFDLTLENLRGSGVTTAWYDPFRDVTTPLRPLAATASSLTLRLPTTDSPRLLFVTEAQAGPLVERPKLSGTTVSFRANVAGRATIAWGAFPRREGGTQVLAVQAGQSVTYDVPGLKPGDAVRVRLAANGLDAVWPRWDWDAAGVVR